MEEEPKRSVFWLESYKISEFSFKEPLNPDDVEISINFQVSGEYIILEKKFLVNFEFSAFNDNDKRQDQLPEPFVFSKLTGVFNFVEEKSISLEEIPEYFYSNAIGILFPFLRGFVSSLTLQAGLRILILPILNVSNLGPQLKEKTTVI